MNENFNLEIWLINAIKNVKRDGITQDFHVNEIFKNYKRFASKKRLSCSFEILNDSIKILSQININGIGIYLHIDLIEIGNAISGEPKNLDEIQDQLSLHCIPEIIVYKPLESETVNHSEFYSTPILYSVYNFQEQVNVFYKEYRTEYDMMTNENFNRELNLIYSPN